MRTIVRLFVIALLLPIYSCSKDDRTANAENEINWRSLPQTDLQNEFEIVDVVRLESSPESLMKSAKKVSYFNGNFFVLDPREYCIFIFKESGEFVKKIINDGDGPNTLDVIVDFDINEPLGTVDLLSPKGRMVSYNIEAGTFETLFDLRGDLPALHSFVRLNSDLLCFYSLFSPNQLLLFSLADKEIIGEYVPAISSSPIFGPSITFLRKEGLPLYLDVIQSKLYDIDENGAYVNTEYKLGEKHLRFSKEDLLQWQNGEQLMTHLEEQRADFPITNLFLSDEIKGITFYSGGRNSKTIFKRDGEEWKHLSLPLEKHSFLPFATSSKAGYVGLLRDPSEFSSLFSSVEDPQSTEFNTDDENPILIVYK